MPDEKKLKVRARYQPALPVPYPEIPTRGLDKAALDSALASEHWWRKEYPHAWLRNLQHASAQAVTVKELRQIVAELIYVLARSAELRWPL